MLYSIILTKIEHESSVKSYPFDVTQIAAMDGILQVVEIDEEGDDKLIDAIHMLYVSFICRERDEFVDEKDFVVSRYYFIILTCIDENDKFKHVR